MAFEVSRVGFYGLKTHEIVSKSTLMVKANSGGFKRVNHMVNGKKVNGVSHLGSKNLSDQLPKQIGNVNEQAYISLLSRFVEDTFVYRQTFVIRSYEIGPDKTATMETLMNLLQETALNHVTSSGLAGNGFGATREMSLRKLIWVVTRIHVQVEKYSSWGDVIDIETWVDAAGKNGMRRDWIIRERNSQKIITRATSTWVMMNRETRKLSKIPSEVRREVQPFYHDRAATYPVGTDLEKIGKLDDETADIIRSGLAPRWSDMDANQHVNNVKYIGWILESVPIDVLAHYSLTSMTLEYRRECRQSNVLESLTTINPKMSQDTKISRSNIDVGEELKSTHLIRMQDDKVEIVRAKSEWKSKQKNMT